MTSEKDPLVSERSGTVREVGNHAIWSLSSCKPGPTFYYDFSDIVANIVKPLLM